MTQRGVIVVGPEGTGSVFIARVISHVIGHCRDFGDWDGYGFNDAAGAENRVLHRSIPFMRPKQFHHTPEELLDLFAGYDDVRFVLTSRDRTLANASKMRRFGGSVAEAEDDLSIAMPLFEALLVRDDTFLWSFETMVLYGAPYFQRLYRFLGVTSDFMPEIIDANANRLDNADAES